MATRTLSLYDVVLNGMTCAEAWEINFTGTPSEYSIGSARFCYNAASTPVAFHDEHDFNASTHRAPSAENLTTLATTLIVGDSKFVIRHP